MKNFTMWKRNHILSFSELPIKHHRDILMFVLLSGKFQINLWISFVQVLDATIFLLVDVFIIFGMRIVEIQIVTLCRTFFTSYIKNFVDGSYTEFRLTNWLILQKYLKDTVANYTCTPTFSITIINLLFLTTSDLMVRCKIIS